MSTASVIVPTNPADLQAIKQLVKNASDSLTRIESERAHIKSIKDKAKEDYQLPPKLFSKMVSLYFKDSFKDEMASNEELDLLYSAVLGKPDA